VSAEWGEGVTTPLVVGWRTRTAVVVAALFLLLPAAPAPTRDDDPTPRTPAELYPGLFERVQLERVYEDGKTFVDSLPRSSPEAILEDTCASATTPASTSARS